MSGFIQNNTKKPKAACTEPKSVSWSKNFQNKCHLLSFYSSRDTLQPNRNPLTKKTVHVRWNKPSSKERVTFPEKLQWRTLDSLHKVTPPKTLPKLKRIHSLSQTDRKLFPPPSSSTLLQLRVGVLRKYRCMQMLTLHNESCAHIRSQWRLLWPIVGCSKQ